MERRSVGSWVDDFLTHGPELAYVQRRGYRTERVSYRQVAELSYQFARELEARGVQKGDRVLLWGENSAEWVAVFFGCALCGAISVPMDDAASPDFAQRVRAQVNARLTICSRKHSQKPGTDNEIVLEELVPFLARQSTEPYRRPSIGPADTLEIIFTSGTTADPKGVVITHGNVLANATPLETEIRKYLKYERWVHPVRFLNLLPLSHVFGQFLGIFLPPLMGGTVIFQESLGPSEVIGTIRRERVSVLVAVPRVLQSLKAKVERDMEDGDQPARFQRKFRSAEGKPFWRRWWTFRRLHQEFGWKFWAFISGGATLDPETEEFWNRVGFAVVQGYGLTETTSLVSVNHPFQLGKGSIGKILPGREVKLAKDGEILVRGGGVASAYWQGDGTEPVTGEAGWYRTGDLGELAADGNLYFKGRKKDVLVTPAGMNIYPADLEAALRKQPEVRDCVVVATPRGADEEPCAVVILHSPDANVDEMMQRANSSLAEYQRMREWFVWPEQDFPRTSTGKPRVNVIRESIRRHKQSKPATAGASPLSDLIAQVSGRRAHDLREDSTLEDDLRLGSLDRVELMSALEDRYQVDLSETNFSAARTVGELEQMLGGEKKVARAEYHYPRWTLSWPIRWLRTAAYYLLMRPAIMLLGWPRIEGRENLTDVKGPVLVVCNHIDDVDVGFVQTALSARLRHWLATATGGEALEALRTPPAGRNKIAAFYDRLQWISGVALLNLFPLPRAAAFLKSFSYAGECIDRGYSVLVFPEGHHTTDGQLRPFRAGVGLLATRLHVPVVPMRIDGLFDIKRARKRFAPPGKIRVRIGKPVSFEPTADPQWIALELQSKVDKLRLP